MKLAVAIALATIVSLLSGCVGSDWHFLDLHVGAEDWIVSARENGGSAGLYRLGPDGQMDRLPIDIPGDLLLPQQTSDGRLHFVVADEARQSIWTLDQGEAVQQTLWVTRITAFAPRNDSYFAFVPLPGQEAITFDTNRRCAYPETHLMLMNGTAAQLWIPTTWCGERSVFGGPQGDLFVDGWPDNNTGPRMWRLQAGSYNLVRMVDVNENPYGANERYLRWECVDPNDATSIQLSESLVGAQKPAGEREGVRIFDTVTGQLGDLIPAQGRGCLLPDHKSSISRAFGCMFTCIDRIEAYDTATGRMRVVVD